MTREWKPGDVGLIPFTFSPDVVGIFVGDGWVTHHNANPLGYNDVRPLVVIDPEDREAVERLLSLEAEQHGQPDAIKPHHVQMMQAALREFASPKPSKPDEPQGLGAVVEAVYDNHFVRENVTKCGWRRVSRRGDEPLCEWDEIAVVRVLSPGVEVDQ